MDYDVAVECAAMMVIEGDFLSSNLNVEVGEKQKILETSNIIDRGTLLLQYMLKEIQMLEIKHEIQKKVHTDIDQQQRDYFLRQQIKVLQEFNQKLSDPKYFESCIIPTGEGLFIAVKK